MVFLFAPAIVTGAAKPRVTPVPLTIYNKGIPVTKKQLDVDFYELRYDPTARAETAQRTRKLRRRDSSHLNPQPFGEPDQDSQSEEGFNTTYQPARYEKGFLLESLHSFYEQALITDVLSKIVRARKPAYIVAAHPATAFN